MTRKRKRNPQDATLRNVRALKAQVARLRLRIDAIGHRVRKIERPATA
jgi:hypothetical protein